MVKSPEGKVQGESRRVVTGQSESAEGRRLRRGAKPDTKPSKKGSTGQAKKAERKRKGIELTDLLAAVTDETGEKSRTTYLERDRRDKRRKRRIYQTQGQSLDNGEGGLRGGKREGEEEERERGEGKCESKESSQAGQPSQRDRQRRGRIVPRNEDKAPKQGGHCNSSLRWLK
ncbi:hypothetical protein An07g06070 [Aspergillus niger]|uniref:Uncharacterized protein n=2 Tax=Aspergillus niger TaxID=5061 RepID=E2PSS4_ASPNC|nr:hypothetical protein An07g06070 [Aspergillus niger]CAK48977.1 hypothetical protein An07g06070 [Aspergillus niger]